MTADEIQAAIDRAQAKRRELQEQQPEMKQSAKPLSILLRAAQLYRRQIEEGLDGNPRALKARVFLREWFLELAKDQSGGRPIEEEVVPFDGSTDG